jgi:hypothetical protein
MNGEGEISDDDDPWYLPVKNDNYKGRIDGFHSQNASKAMAKSRKKLVEEIGQAYTNNLLNLTLMLKKITNIFKQLLKS